MKNVSVNLNAVPDRSNPGLLKALRVSPVGHMEAPPPPEVMRSVSIFTAKDKGPQVYCTESRVLPWNKEGHFWGMT